MKTDRVKVSSLQLTQNVTLTRVITNVVKKCNNFFNSNVRTLKTKRNNFFLPLNSGLHVKASDASG